MMMKLNLVIHSLKEVVTLLIITAKLSEFTPRSSILKRLT